MSTTEDSVAQDSDDSSSMEQDDPLQNVVADPENLDPEGDMILLAGDHRIRVSSKILSLASPPLKALLNSNFREGAVKRTTVEPLNLPLPDDDAFAIAVLMSILHFQILPSFVPTNKQFGAIITVAQKYLCLRAVAGQCDFWLTRFRYDLLSAVELDVLARAAYVLDNALQFSRIIKALVRICRDCDYGIPDLVTVEQLRTCDLRAIESTLLRSIIKTKRVKLLLELRNDIERTLRHMQNSESGIIYAHGLQNCNECGYEVEPVDGECPNCDGHIPPSPTRCDASHRSEKFLQIMEKTFEYPGMKYFTSPPPAHLPARLESIRTDSLWKHKCLGYEDCPLAVALLDLQQQFEKTIDSVEGLDLDEFKRDVQQVTW